MLPNMGKYQARKNLANLFISKQNAGKFNLFYFKMPHSAWKNICRVK